MKRLGFLVGMVFGFLLAAGRLNDYTAIHDMLLLRSSYFYLLMATTVLVGVAGLQVLARRRWVTPLGGPFTSSRAAVERKHVLGGAIFGLGWAVAGTCPGAVLAMVGVGNLMGLFVVAGLFAGLMLRGWVADRQAAPTLPATAAAIAR